MGRVLDPENHGVGREGPSTRLPLDSSYQMDLAVVVSPFHTLQRPLPKNQ
jgi:hypothetical protein